MLAKSSTEMVRRQNSALVLSALRRHGRLAHTELSAATGLASATISAITAYLERTGIIGKIEQQAASGRGRPRVLFSQRRDCGYLVTIVISFDMIQYSLVDYAGTLIDRFAEPRREDGASTLSAAVAVALEKVAGRSRIDPAQVLIVSVSSKGLVHPAGPVLLWSPVFGAQPVDFATAVKDGWTAKVILNNETLLVAGALLEREAKKPSGGHGSLAALSLGHSIGLGIARRDSATGAAEIIAPNFGHMLHMPNGGLCRCGERGCIEAHAGFYAVLRAAFEVPLDTIPAKFVPIAEIDKIAASARQGNRMAKLAFRQAGVALGNGLSRLFCLQGQMPVYLTGPGTRHQDLLQPGIEEGLLQTQVVRLGGMPELTIVEDEPSLVFEGHLSLAFSILDQDIIQARHHCQTVSSNFCAAGE